MRFDKNSSWHAFYGTLEAPHKRILFFPDRHNHAAFEKVRDRAIEERDVESVVVVLEVLYNLVDGVNVTREGVEKQMVNDFEVPLEALNKVSLTDARLAELGISIVRRGPVPVRGEVPYGLPRQYSRFDNN